MRVGKRVFPVCLVLVLLLLTCVGCASSLHMQTGQANVPGYGTVTALTIESINGGSSNLHVVQTYSGGRMTGEYHHGNDGILYPVLSGAIQAAGMVGGAAVLRPSRYESNVSGVSNAASGATANSASEANANQYQYQYQIQDKVKESRIGRKNPYHPPKWGDWR